MRYGRDGAPARWTARGGVLMVFLLLGVARARFASDWPQLQKDAARGGYTDDSPKPPFKGDWQYDFVEAEHDKIHPVVQAVVYEGKVFVPSRRGRVYAFDAETGKKAFAFQAGGPIVNTVGCGEGLVVFGCLDGKIYAVRSSDGSKAWEFESDLRGFCTAPCIAGGKVFMGSRSGTFYCLDLKTGRKVWATDVGAFIFHTAACADGRVFFGTEEMKVVCLDARTGKEKWKSEQCIGVTFKDGNAFVDQGKVVVIAWNTAKPLVLDLDTKAYKASIKAGKYYPVPDELQDKLLAAVKGNPVLHRELYVLDAGTGKEAYIPVHGKISSVDGPAFSVCRDGKGNWVSMIHPRTRWSKAETDFRTALAFARMNPETGRLIDVIWTPDCKISNPDEANAMTVGGRILFCSEQEEGEAGIFTAFDLTRPKRIPIGGRFPGPNTQGHGNLEYDEQPLCNPIAISGDRFYRISNHALRCWKGQ